MFFVLRYDKVNIFFNVLKSEFTLARHFMYKSMGTVAWWFAFAYALCFYCWVLTTYLRVKHSVKKIKKIIKKKNFNRRLSSFTQNYAKNWASLRASLLFIRRSLVGLPFSFPIQSMRSHHDDLDSLKYKKKEMGHIGTDSSWAAGPYRTANRIPKLSAFLASINIRSFWIRFPIAGRKYQGTRSSFNFNLYKINVAIRDPGHWFDIGVV